MTQPIDYSAFQVDASVEPLPIATNRSLLQDADPVIFHALSFFRYLIETYPGPRLVQEVIAAGMYTGAVTDPIRFPVAQAYSWPPDLEFQSNQFKFPLLALYRKTATHEHKTAAWEHDRCTVDLFYALPPITAGQTEALHPIFRAIAATIRLKTTQGWDPGYAPPGGNLGDQPWSAPFAGLEKIGWERTSWGTMPGTGNLKFPFLLMEGYVLERDIYVPGQKFAGADITGNLVADDQTTVPSFLQVSTQQAPTITSVSPNNGTIAGGTPVTITGTLFLPGPMVLFGNTPATSIVQVSPTSITCVTPPVSGTGTLSVVVVNRDSQSAIAPNAFTYS